jgi:hypothetical protein
MKDRSGKNALHYAIEYADDRIVLLVLSKVGCDVNCADNDAMTPLHIAIKRRRLTIVEELLSGQTEPQVDVNITNMHGQTPLHLAAQMGLEEVIRNLLLTNLEQKCDTTILDNQQLTAYDTAKREHHDICARLIEEYQTKARKATPMRMLSTSLHERSLIGAMSTISLTPAANLDRRHDETSDDSLSISSKASIIKIKPKRSSDQWSDDEISLTNTSKHKIKDNHQTTSIVSASSHDRSMNLVQQNTLPMNELQKNTSSNQRKTSTNGKTLGFMLIIICLHCIH